MEASSIGARDAAAPDDGGGDWLSQWDDEGYDMRNRSKRIWYDAMRDDYWFRQLVGTPRTSYDKETPTVAMPTTSLYPPGYHPGEETLENSVVEVRPFRDLASGLPFAVQFRLELFLFNNEMVEVQRARPPKGVRSEAGSQNSKEELFVEARRLVVALINAAVPPLLEVDWRGNLDVENFTLAELFAEAIGPGLSELKRKVRDSQGISFDRLDVESAMGQAEGWLRKAVKRCCAERELGKMGDRPDVDMDILQRRAMWPYAEYSVRFLPGGDLVPAEYEVINCPPYSSFSLKPTSRRALREGGWPVRDRFCRVTNSFDVSEELVDWIRLGPVLCGRRYVLLFDKGVGINMKVWLFSEHSRGTSALRPDLEVTRDRFLSSLGNLGGVATTKVGDRIGLAFSQTAPIVRLSQDQIVAIPEIVHDGYAFSDGNGVMGLEVARAIQKVLSLEKAPGAVQIRIGGVKGMLSLMLDFEPNAIGIRPSQIKFSSTHNVLEIKAHAVARVGNNKLFKESLLVMDHLGVRYDYFYNLREQACAKMIVGDTSGTVDSLTANGSPSKWKECLAKALRFGAKADGSLFTKAELEKVRLPMIEAREKINILCSGVSVMFGIIDEYDVLEENEVLICNGKITGEVLILRAPCMFPGDIQKATAVAGKPDKSFTRLDHVLVFSAKGDRPLADMLGGGDLDGDRFHIIHQKEILDAVTLSDPHNFGTRKESVQSIADISSAFCSLEEQRSHVAPNIEQQLEVIQNFMTMGNLVGSSADAWLRHADKHGVAHDKAQKLASLHQRALDSRKAYDSIDQSELEFMNNVLQLMPTPHYKRKGLGSKTSSLLGVLYECWVHDIKAIDRLIKLCDSPSQLSGSLDVEIEEIMAQRGRTYNDVKNLDWSRERKAKGGAFKYCATCGIMKECKVMKKCAICEVVWACVGKCEVTHWRMCFGCHWRESAEMLDDFDDESSTLSGSTLSSITGSFSDSREITATTVTLTSFGGSESSPSTETRESETVEDLLEIVFGNKAKPTCAGLDGINWERLDSERDLFTLRQMAIVEFYAGFDRERKDVWKKTQAKVENAPTPHHFDVFVMDRLLRRDDISLAVLMKNESNMPMWCYELGKYCPVEPAFHLFRVASLSATLRILESLNASPLPPLMESALKRNVDDFIMPNDDVAESILQLSQDISLSDLNEAQKKAVAAVCNPDFREGFMLVHGPPGTGKTVTLSAMIASVGKAIVVAPSNAAVANVAKKVLACSQFNVGNVVVFGDNCDDSVAFVNPVHRSRIYQKFQKEYCRKLRQGLEDPDKLLSSFADWLDLDKKSLMESKKGLIEKMWEGLAKSLRLPVNHASREVIEGHCPRIDETDKGQAVLSRILKKAKVVLCTLNSSGSSFLRRAVCGKFDTLFLDEAAQCPEAEFYIATTFPGIKRIVLIGDPKQLNATVLNRDCEYMRYGESWMKHVMDLHSSSIQAHVLNVQYRSDDKILAFSNKQFYGGKITTAEVVRRRVPEIANPFLFINTYPHGWEDREGLSVKNPYEAERVRALLKDDKDIKRLRKDRADLTIMVISPYKAQVELVRKLLSKMKNRPSNIKVATVDSFQGQEADVVILSLVRTESAGFVADPQRINVALTRAKRVLRIVGDLEFWESNQSPQALVLRNLVQHCKENGFVGWASGKKKSKGLAWMTPNWSRLNDSLWKPILTSYFHHSLKDLPSPQKNVAINTLIALAEGRVKILYRPPRQDNHEPRWQISALDGHETEVRIVWCAKNGEPKPTIEAHCAGSNEKCLNFRDTHPALPAGAVRVKRDMSGIFAENVNDFVQSKYIEPAWALTESLGDAMLDTDLDELPEGCFELDKEQKEILWKKLPLMLESGSGTGKTNVLFQHAVNHALKLRDFYSGKDCICFVTVSPRLRQDLKQRYDTVKDMEKTALPSIKFYSLRELLSDLLLFTKLDVSLSRECTFIQYVTDISRKTKTGASIGVEDVREAENEICGVILGSIDAAKAGRALTREEYINARSYIEKNTDEGIQKRHKMFDEYEKYKRWKQAEGRMDLSDVVLELIKEFSKNHSRSDTGGQRAWKQLFSAVYLDEVQDFSYAAIYLITNIAGRSNLHWVFAGDTAQMISPGCSFTFRGLKDTLLEVKSGIESKIKEVEKMGRNYRVTKDVLDVSNSLLNLAKMYFKHDMEYIRPEIPVKNLGTRVRLCPWQDALNLRPKFGPDQALIYASTRDPKEVFDEMNEWLNKTHPYVLTTLEVKGLEFEDCVLAFDVERKVWDIKSRKAASLSLIRQLYVANTRSKRRVVILYKTAFVRKFFLSLSGCNIEESPASVALLEFDTATTEDEWFKAGMKHKQEEQFRMAASCFKNANNFAYFEWMQGRYQREQGQEEDAKQNYRSSANLFFEQGDFEHTLELLALVMELPPWNPDDDHIYDKATEALPSYFPATTMIDFALHRNKWNEIRLDYLKNESTAKLFLGFRENEELKAMIAACSKDDRDEIEYYLPLLVADYYQDMEDYLNATRLFLQQNDPSEQDRGKAEMSTNLLINESQSLAAEERTSALNSIASIWRNKIVAMETVSPNSDTSLLLKIYENPVDVAKRRRSAEAMRKFGPGVIKKAFEVSNEPMEELHSYSRNQFQSDVDQALSMKYRGSLIEAVQWFLHHDDPAHAEAFARSNMHSWSKDDILAIAQKKLNPKGLIDAADSRDGLVDLVKTLLSSEVFNLKKAVQVSDRALSSLQKANAHFKGLISVWDKHKNDGRVKKILFRKQPFPPGPDTSVFLHLYWDPKYSSKHLSQRCMELFGPSIIEDAVSSKIDDDKEKFEVLCGFDKEAFVHLRPPAKFKPGDRVVVHSLRNRSDINGKAGSIRQRIEETGRYEVKLDERVKAIAILPSNLKIDDSKNNPFPPRPSRSNRADMDPSPAQPKDKQQSDRSSSSDDELPPLNARDQSSSEDSSSDDSVPSLLERGNRSNSSDSSEDASFGGPQARRDESSDDSSSSSVPALTRKDNSSSDEEDIPALIGPGQQSSSSSDESDSAPRPRQPQRARAPSGNAAGRGSEGRARGRGGRGRGGKGKGGRGRKNRK